MFERPAKATNAGQGEGRRLLTLALLPFFALSAAGYEIDPYTNRDVDVADSLVVLDAKVNEALDGIAESWDERPSESGLILAVYRTLGGIHWVDKLERWAVNSDAVAKVPNSRRESIISDFPLHAGRVAAIFGFGPTINIGGAYVGTDKIGHFFSQGRKFYRRYRRLGDEERAARWSVVTETGLFGRLTTGVLSNADLVANYEGYLFYRGLLHDGVVGGKPALFRWQQDELVRQRDFTWRDHVNEFWDEALNPNAYSPALRPFAEQRLLRLCEDFAARPERYQVADAERLFARYRHVGVLDTSWLAPANYLPTHCPSRASAGL